MTAPRQQENSIVKYADDTTIISRIIINDGTYYIEEIDNLAECCREQSVAQNQQNQKDEDFGKKVAKTHTPVYNSRAEVEQVNSLRFLENYIHTYVCVYNYNYISPHAVIWEKMEGEPLDIGNIK